MQSARATDTLHGDDAYNGTSVTTVYTPTGVVVANFTSTAHAVRMVV